MTRHLNLATALIIAIALAVCLVSPLVGMDAPAPGAPVCAGGFCSAPQAARPQRYTGQPRKGLIARIRDRRGR